VFTRIQSPSGDHTIIFDRQFDGVARQVYAQLVAGVRIPPNAKINCPNILVAPYYHYDLMFSRAGTQTGFASSDAHGCQIIKLDPLGGALVGGREYFLWQAPDRTSFWVTLNQLLNAPLPICYHIVLDRWSLPYWIRTHSSFGPSLEPQSLVPRPHDLETVTVPASPSTVIC
jgi:hypothetical protein